MIIAVDFDGTCVTHEFPKVGRDIGAVPVLKKLVESGHKIILYTMRSHSVKEHDTLLDAINWFHENGIPLYGVNENPSQKSWTSSPKAFANLYIDDASLGVPLKSDNSTSRPYVDWNKLETLLIKIGAL